MMACYLLFRFAILALDSYIRLKLTIWTISCINSNFGCNQYDTQELTSSTSFKLMVTTVRRFVKINWALKIFTSMLSIKVKDEIVADFISIEFSILISEKEIYHFVTNLKRAMKLGIINARFVTNISESFTRKSWNCVRAFLIQKNSPSVIFSFSKWRGSTIRFFEAVSCSSDTCNIDRGSLYWNCF